MIDEQIIQNWLVNEGLFKEKIQDPNANFHYIINYPENHIIDIIQPNSKVDVILIGCATEIAQEQLALMRESNNSKKSEYVWDVRYILNSFLLDFDLQVENNELKQFLITNEIFEDGLSKNELIKAIKKVFKAKIQCIWKLEQTFGVATLDSNNLNDEDNMFV
jgi:hypothetical protein